MSFSYLSSLMAVAMLAVMTIAGPLASPANAQSRQEASQRLLAKGLATSDRQDALFLLERALVADPCLPANIFAMR